jgi:hypothetical protein
MPATLHQLVLIEHLLTTTEAERHLRAPLLNTLVAQLHTTQGMVAAADAAAIILRGVESGELSGADFLQCMRALRQVVRARQHDLDPFPASKV